jgi:hypothetical protein
MDRSRHPGRTRARKARGVVEFGRDARKSGLRESGRDRQKANDVSADDRSARSGEAQSDLPAGKLPRDRIDRLIDGDQRREQPERQHGARQRVAQPGDEKAGRGERPANQPQRESRRKPA